MKVDERGTSLEDSREQKEIFFPICLSEYKEWRRGAAHGDKGDEEGSSRRERTRGRQEEATRIHSEVRIEHGCEKLFSDSVVCGCHLFGHSSADQFQCAVEGPKVWRCSVHFGFCLDTHLGWSVGERLSAWLIRWERSEREGVSEGQGWWVLFVICERLPWSLVGVLLRRGVVGHWYVRQNRRYTAKTKKGSGCFFHLDGTRDFTIDIFRQQFR